MLKEKSFSFGTVNGRLYDFHLQDDILPMHNHGAKDVHITIVARGSFKVRGFDWERVVTAGDVLDFQPGDTHEFVALENNSRIVNIIKGV